MTLDDITNGNGYFFLSITLITLNYISGHSIIYTKFLLNQIFKINQTQSFHTFLFKNKNIVKKVKIINIKTEDTLLI